MNPQEHYASEFSKLQGPSRRQPPWLGLVRKVALDRFLTLGFPTLEDEDWKYTSVASIAKTPFHLDGEASPASITVEQLQRVTFGEMECSYLVFLNGRYVPELSQVRKLPEGACVGSLSQALAEEQARVEPYLARHAAFDRSPFVALNTAFLQDGAFVHVPRRKVMEEPVHVIFVTAPNGSPLATHPRNLIVAEEGSQLAVVESYVSLGEAPYLNNAVTEVVAAEGAVVDLCKLQRESPESYHVSTLQTRLSRGARFASHSVSLGGGLTRNDLNMLLDGEGIECVLNGLYLAQGTQHVDNHTFIDHAKPHCSSREFYKGVLGGKSHGVFNGKIMVRKDAQKTDAKQTNKNLLLSEEALVDTKPQLEIYADDVKCTHGATIGQLDEDALFYLRSRGVGREDARSLLIHAFASDLIGRIPVKPVRTGLECLLMTRLPVGVEHREGM